MSQMGEKLAQGIVQRGFWCLELLRIKFIYCEKAAKFEKISQFFLKLPSNMKRRFFFKFVWPSKNIWTL
jgi:hypothetical protein